MLKCLHWSSSLLWLSIKAAACDFCSASAASKQIISMQIFYTNYFKYFAYGGVAGSPNKTNTSFWSLSNWLSSRSRFFPSLSVCLSPPVCLSVCLLAPKNSYLLKLNIYICVFVQCKYVSVCACVCEAKLFYGVCLGQTNSQAELELES